MYPAYGGSSVVGFLVYDYEILAQVELCNREIREIAHHEKKPSISRISEMESCLMYTLSELYLA